MLLTIAGVTVAVVADEPGPVFRVEDATKPFLVDDATPDVTIRVGWGQLLEACDGEQLFDSGALWRLYRRRDSFLFRFTTPDPTQAILADGGIVVVGYPRIDFSLAFRPDERCALGYVCVVRCRRLTLLRLPKRSLKLGCALFC